MRWDHVTNFTSILVDSVSTFVVNKSGMRIGIIKPKKVVANGEKLFDLVLLDFNEMKLHTILNSARALDHISISPKGDWIVFRSLADNGSIYLVSTTENNGERIKLGTCGQIDKVSCSELVWSNENLYLAWSDESGVWVTKPEEIRTERIIKPEIIIKDPEGNISKVSVRFSNLQWSPFGRFLLAKVSSISSNIQWYAIIDTRRKKVALIPDTFSPIDTETNIFWTPNGRILLIQGADIASDNSSYIKTWKVTPTRDDLILLEKNINISPGMILNLSHLPDTESALIVHWTQQWKDNEILFGVTWQDNKTASLLLKYDIENGKISELAKIPIFSSKVLWSPDFSGVLIIGNHESLLYKSFISGEILDLSSILGTNATNFFWLPPKPRSDQ
jgi:hypothetical protein